MQVEASKPTLNAIQEEIIQCRRCPRLVKWREKVAREKTARFRHETYWGRPVPSFGDPKAHVLIVGLAPAAHGGNRTGRIFTGDRSGDWLFRALHKFGFANQPVSIAKGDGLKLQDCYLTAAAHCAPPLNKLLPSELDNCRAFLRREIRVLLEARRKRRVAVIALGKTAFTDFLKAYEEVEGNAPKPRPKFAHGAEARLSRRLLLIASFHPSQQNTFTGKLTEPMFDRIFRRARQWIEE